MKRCTHPHKLSIASNPKYWTLYRCPDCNKEILVKHTTHKAATNG